MNRRICPAPISSCSIAVALLVGHGLLLFPSTSPLRIAAALTLLALPGLAWSEVLFASTALSLRWTMGVGLSYALVLSLGIILHYLPGPILPTHVLLVIDTLVVSALILQRLTRTSPVSATPIHRWATNPVIMALLLIVALAAAFRLLSLGYSEFQGDEINAMLPAARALEGFDGALFERKKGPGDIVVPTFIWALTGTINEASARLPFAIAGIMSILTTYQLGRRFGTIQAGLAAAALMALSGLLVAFSRIVQYQVLVVLMTSLTLLSALEWRRTWQIRWALVAAVFLATGIIAHYDAMVIIPALAYVAIVAWRTSRRDRTPGRPIKLAISLVAGTATLLLLAGLFYVPFWLGPQTDETVSYLSRRIGEGLIKNTLTSFLHYNIFYSSFYYVAITGLLVLGFLMWAVRPLPILSRIPGWRLWGPVLILLTGLGIMAAPNALALGNLELAPLIFGALLVGMLLSPALSIDQRAVALWFATAFWGYNFLLDQPLTHIYVVVVPWSLLAGFSAAGLGRWSATRLNTRMPALIVGLVLIALFSSFLYVAYLRQDVEYWQDWPESRSMLYWAPPAYDELPQFGVFGFAHRTGWKAVGNLYASGLLKGDYFSNEKRLLPRWYAPGAVQTARQELELCGDGPEFIFLADDVVEASNRYDVDPTLIEENYKPVGRVVLPNGKGLSIYQEDPVTLDLGNLEEPALALAFDRAAVPETFNRTSLPSVPIDVNFGDIRLEGYDLKFADDQLSVSLFWRALADVQEDLHVFLHLEGGIEGLETSGIRGQSDGTPRCSLAPTSTWQAEELVIDRRSFAIDAETPTGEYALVVGLYRPETGTRLDVLDDEGRPIANYAKLTTISVP